MKEKVLSKELKERLEKYPALKGYVENFIKNRGMNSDATLLSDLVVYVRELDIDVSSFFNWDCETYDNFCSWGCNSRYANVFEPLLWTNLEEYLSLLIDWFDEFTSDYLKVGAYQTVEDKRLFNLIKNGMEEN